MELLLTAGLCFSRIAALFALVPLPGVRTVISIPKIALASLTTLLLTPWWRNQRLPDVSVPAILFWLLTELFIGLSIGLAVAFLTESFTLAAQLAGLQAGFSYASTIDPSSQADATVLTVIAQLIASLLFFALGLDGEILRALAASLQSAPPGTLEWGRGREQILTMVLHLGTVCFATALRLALPIIGMLALVDLALGLVSRITVQFQFLSAAFPLKASLVLLLLAALTSQMPAMFEQTTRHQRALWAIWEGR